MSDLSELIEINKNIEKQNEEIIRLLKKIAGEDESYEYVQIEPQKADFNEIEADDLLDNTLDVGEVYFIDGGDIFHMTVKENEIIQKNLTSDVETVNNSVQENVAFESVRLNQCLPESSVILNRQNCENLPDVLRICIEQGAKKVYIPWYEMTQLIGAPESLMTMIKLDFYKTEEMLFNKLFDYGD